ncbi:MAG: DUF4153 domain-containing protein [Rhodobacteraceae bacterium]|nr:DUF4153 domain-containing protein [Paracoccaceae bacterium]
MAAAATNNALSGRAVMAGVGGLVGLAMWLLFDVAADVVTNPHGFVILASFVAGFSAVLLAMAGPLRLGRAALGATLLALPAALALGWASYGFDELETFMQSGLSIVAWSAILFIGTPFLTVALRPEGDWRSYPALFDASWAVVVRYAAAWLFVGVFWGILLLSNALLEIVDITVIDDMLDIDPMPHVLTGVMLGLAIRVVHEMRDYLSPFMLLRLLRLLVPVVLVVLGIFVAALPFRPFDGLFGELSPAATLLVVALGAVSLVSVAVDKDADHAVQLGFMRLATEGLALLLPVLAGLAGYAVWLRVAQYGWTPDRIAAGIAAGMVILYGLAYALSVLLRGAWMQHVRVVNLGMALLVLMLAFAWLTPVINAEKISTRNQVARYLAGKVDAGELAIWEMKHVWGRAGEKGLAQLQALEGEEHAALHRAIDLAIETDQRHIYERRATDTGRDARVLQLAQAITVLPEGQEISAEMLAGLPNHRLEDWALACAREEVPGCVVVLGRFDTRAEDGQSGGIAFLPGRAGRYDALGLRISEDGRLVLGSYLRDVESGMALHLTREDVERVLEGSYRIAPSSRKSLWIGDMEINPEN